MRNINSLNEITARKIDRAQYLGTEKRADPLYYKTRLITGLQYIQNICLESSYVLAAMMIIVSKI